MHNAHVPIGPSYHSVQTDNVLPKKWQLTSSSLYIYIYTGSRTCGTHSICSTYASSVWYADDLANRALHGFVQYQRQAFVGGNYGLTASFNEHPQSALGATEALLLRTDYWLNFMWKRTLGTRVYNMTSTDSNIRVGRLWPILFWRGSFPYKFENADLSQMLFKMVMLYVSTWTCWAQAYAFSGTPPSAFAAPECKVRQTRVSYLSSTLFVSKRRRALVTLHVFSVPVRLWSA